MVVNRVPNEQDSFIAKSFRRLHDQLKGEGMRARILRGGAGSALVQVLSRILMLLSGIVLARCLGPEGYGVYAYAFAIMSLLMVVAEAGVPTLLLREVAVSFNRREWGMLRGMLFRGGRFVLITALLVSGIGLAVFFIMGERENAATFYTTCFMLMVLPLTAMCRTLACAIRGLQQIVIGLTVEKLLRPVLFLLSVSTLFYLRPDLRSPQYAMAMQFAASLVVIFVSLLVLRRFLPKEVLVEPASYPSREWIKKTLSFTLIGGAGIINNQADIVMLGWYCDNAEVGIYRVAVQGATLVAFGLRAVNSVVAPQFAGLYAQGDLVRLQRLVTMSARGVLAVALPVSLLFMVEGGRIAGWVFGAAFVDSQMPLAILAFGQLINAAMGSVGFLLNMTGYENDVARVVIGTALLNVVLNSILIPFWGISGAATATAISLVMWNLILYVITKKRIGINSTAFLFV